MVCLNTYVGIFKTLGGGCESFEDVENCVYMNASIPKCNGILQIV